MKQLEPAQSVQSTPTAADAAHSSGINVMHSLREHPRLAATAFLGGVLLGLPFLLFKLLPVYEAEALIYISPTFIRNLSEDREQQVEYNSFIQQQVVTVTRSDLIEEALQRAGNSRPRWQQANETVREAAERLQRALDVRRVPDTYQLSIRLHGKDPQLLAGTVNSVANTLIDKSKADVFYDRNQRIATLTAERSRLQQEIVKTSDESAELSQALGVATTAAATGDKGVRQPNDELDRMKQHLAVVRKARLDAEANLATLKRAAGALATGTPEEIVALDPTLNAWLADLNRRRSDVRARMIGLLPNHPVRQRAEGELAELDDEQRRMAALVDKASSRQVAKAVSDAQGARRVEAQVQAEVDRFEGNLVELSRKFRQATDLTGQMTQAEARVKAIDERIAYLNLEGDAPGFLRVSAAALPPITPVPNKWKESVILLLAASGLLGLGVPVARDLFDTKVRHARDVELILGFAPLGIVMEGNSSSQEFADEQLHRVVVGIQRATKTFGLKTVVLTPVRAGGGTTSLIESLAHELAARGVKTLTIAANGLGFGQTDPSQHLPGVLARPAGVEPAVQENVTPSPAPAALQRIHDLHLPSTTRLTAALQEFVVAYDIVLVDAPPLLTSADAQFIAGICDATLLVIDAEQITKEELHAAGRLLERVHPKAVGAILNRVSLDRADVQLRKDYDAYIAWRQAEHTAS